MDDYVLTVKDVALRWQCSVDAVYDALRRGELIGFKIGNAKRVRLSAVEEYERTHTTARPKKEWQR